MTPKDLLAMVEKASSVGIHYFILSCKKKPDQLFCFFEGKDSQYYSTRVKAFVKGYMPISCGNKKNVIETYNWFKKKKEYSGYKRAFFVDLDFDVKIANPEIYETPCYSVENFYVTSECLSEILKNEFLLIEEQDEYKVIMDLFQKELDTYCQETLLFNAWYAALKLKKREKGLDSTLVNLSEKLPNGFLLLKIGGIKSNYDLNKIKEKFPSAIEVSEEEVLQAQKRLCEGVISQNLRGKFQMNFLYTFLQYLIQDANSGKGILPKKVKFNIDRANIITFLSQYASTPECLIGYLAKFS